MGTAIGVTVDDDLTSVSFASPTSFASSDTAGHELTLPTSALLNDHPLAHGPIRVDGPEFVSGLGRPDPIVVDGVVYAREVVLTRHLRAVLGHVELYLGEAPGAAVFYHPDQWGPAQTAVFERCARAAGFDVTALHAYGAAVRSWWPAAQAAPEAHRPAHRPRARTPIRARLATAAAVAGALVLVAGGDTVAAEGGPPPFICGVGHPDASP